jgi:uncharacterized membrane protein
MTEPGRLEVPAVQGDPGPEAPHPPEAPAVASPSGRVSARNAEELRVIVSSVLTIGIAISAALLLLGFVAALLVGWGGSLLGRPEAGYSLNDFTHLARGLADLRAGAIGQLGLIALVLTPVARVAASVVLFAVERDRLYVVVTLIVLAVLLASLLLIR